MKKNINMIRCNSGATAIEFAIVAFPLLIILMGIIEFSLIYYAKSVIENSTTIGSRLAITGNNYDTDSRVSQKGAAGDRVDMIRKNIIKQANGLLDDSKLSITCSNLGRNFNGTPPRSFGNHVCGGVIDNSISCSNAGAGGDIVVYNVSYCWEVLTPIASLFTGYLGSTTFRDEILLTSSLVVQNEEFTP
jgi:TadE-like protein